MERLKRILKLFWVAGLGIAIFFIGVIYGTITVGVPYIDPTEAQLAYQTRHDAISQWILLIGLAVFLIGLFYIPIRIWMNRKS